MTQERNCAFQYAEIRGSIVKDTKIVHDQSELTFSEAKELWNKYYPQAAKLIKNGDCVEMCIWIDVETPHAYGKHHEYISTDAESDGVYIWEIQKKYFTKEFKE